MTWNVDDQPPQELIPDLDVAEGVIAVLPLELGSRVYVVKDVGLYALVVVDAAGHKILRGATNIESLCIAGAVKLHQQDYPVFF